MEDRTEFNTYDLTFEQNIALMPDFFYKYTKISDRVKENIANNQLWFSKPGSFNDPFDCKAYINFGSSEEECKANFRKYRNGFGVPPNAEHEEVLDAIAKSPEDFNLIHSLAAAREFESFLGVSCFSENYDNNLMWSHYADSCRGIVLEFKKDISKFLTKNLLPVNYYEEYPIVNVSDYKEDQMIAVAYQFICAKGADWAYEDEWRAIIAEGDTTQKYDKEELTGIIFGLNTSDNDKAEIHDLILNSGYKEVTFREAVFEYRGFKVDYLPYSRHRIDKDFEANDILNLPNDKSNSIQ